MDKLEKLIKTFDDAKIKLLRLQKEAGKGKATSKKNLEKEIKYFWGLLFPDLPYFKTAAEALRHLEDQKYKIKHTKFYQDIKKKLILVQSDKRIYKADLDSYILREELRKTTDEDLDELNIQTFQKTEKEVIKLDKQIRDLDTSHNEKIGLLVNREERDQEDIEKIIELREGFLSFEFRLPPLLEGLDQNKMRPVIRIETSALLNNFSKTGKFEFPKEKKKGKKNARKK